MAELHDAAWLRAQSIAAQHGTAVAFPPAGHHYAILTAPDGASVQVSAGEYLSLRCDAPHLPAWPPFTSKPFDGLMK